MPPTRYLLLFISLVAAPVAVAEQSVESAAEKGAAIATEADRRASGYVDSEESLTMALRDSKGRERLRTMRIKTFERSDDGDWSLTIFDEPADVKGTALLTYSHGVDPDDQWIYLPALTRVKRISSRNRSGPFMGSEFAFEDMSAFELEKYSYRYLRDEPCGELTCFVSEWIPAYEHSGYTRMEIWHDQDEYRVHRIEFFDRVGKHLKTLLLSDYRLYDERFWRALHWEMTNHKTGKITLLDFNSIEFGAGLTERDFDQNALKRAK
jgi:outer membrane lipoprotein-sorting protein